MPSDFRYVARSLLRARSYTFGALLTFAVGIGANIAIFAVVDRILFRPLPFHDPDRLAMVSSVHPKTRQVYFVFPKTLAVEARRHSTAVDDIAYAGNTRRYYLEGPDTRPLWLTEASFNVLDVLGVQPVHGRAFTPDDVTLGLRLVLLREEVWRGQYGADPHILSRRFADRLGPAAIVGVLPAGFVIPSVNWAVKSDGLLLTGDLLEMSRSRETVPAIFARLHPKATFSLLQQQFDALVVATQGDRPESERTSVRVEPMQRGLFWNCRVPLSILFAGGLLVWLVTCTNLGTLMAARARSREHQLAIRMSLGAPKTKILTLIATESASLCGAGATVAVIVLLWTLRGLAALIPTFVQPLVLTSLDWRVIGYSLLAAAGGSVVASVYPCWAAYRLDAQAALQRASASARMPRGTGSALLVAESAIGTALVLAGGLAIRSFVGLVTTDLGFSPAGLHAVSVNIAQPTDPWARLNLNQRVIETLHTQAGVVDAAAVDIPVFGGEAPRVLTDALGRHVVVRRILGPYFYLMGTRLLAGRLFSEAETREELPVAVLSASAVHLLWPNIPIAHALGRTLEFKDEPVRRLVGVVGDTRPRHGVAVEPEVLTPGGSDMDTLPTFLVRTAGARVFDTQALRNRLRRDYDRGAVLSVSSASRQLEPWLQNPKLYAEVFGAFGLIGLMLSAIGLFAVTSFEVSLRQHEIGVRMAFGGTVREITWMLVKEAVRPVALGVALGILGAFCLARLFQSLLYNVDARDVVMYAGVAALLLATAIVSACWAAQHARHVDPLTALRAQ